MLRKMCFGLAHKFRLHVWVREFLLWPPNFIFQLELVRCVANQSDQLLSHLSVPVQNTQLLHAQPHISHVHEQSKMWLFLSECQSDRGGSRSFILKNIFWSLLLLILSVFFVLLLLLFILDLNLYLSPTAASTQSEKRKNPDCDSQSEAQV